LLAQLAFVFLCLLTSPFVQALELHEVLPADQERLREEFPRVFSESPTQAELDDVIRSLMKTGVYETVSFERTERGEWAINARPIRTIQDIRFIGQDAFSRSKLIEVVGLEIGNKFDRKKAVAAAEKLKAFYGESGYFNTVINLSFPKGKGENVILEFNIQESAPCRVDGLELNTENSVLKQRLLGRLSRYVKRPLSEDLIRTLTKRANEYFIDHRYQTLTAGNFSSAAITSVRSLRFFKRWIGATMTVKMSTPPAKVSTASSGII
jgi:outer membrane protein assembly factor BamA